ncbi:MAG: hypothetical protein AAGF60_04950 [Pseudomonadota bacterium]
MISVAMIVQFLMVAALLGAAAVLGYVLAARRVQEDSGTQIVMVSGEMMRLRRRLADAERRADSAEAALSRERRRHRARAV